METEVHNLNTLFQQLGLPDGDVDIDRFIEEHRPLAREVSLQKAAFWSRAQAGFLREAIEEDADWAEVVDELDVRLHEMPSARPPTGTNWLRESAREFLPEMCGY